MSRTGDEYLNDLDDGRDVFINGERVDDVTQHPAFRGAALQMAKFYDFSADPENDVTFTSPTSGEEVNLAWKKPKSRDELEKKRVSMQKAADYLYGWIGRGPDHVANSITGMSCGSQIFSEPDDQFGENVDEFYEFARDRELFLHYDIIPPKYDRSKQFGEQEDHPAVKVVEERDDGIVVEGSQLLATSGALSDWLLLSNYVPMQPGDEDFAVTAVMPMNTDGLMFAARPSFAQDKPSVYDYPLSTRFDETDSLAIFDHVFIPWERVFVYRNLDVQRRSFFEAPAHVFQNTQAQVRLVAKLRFITGAIKKMTDVIKTSQIPPVMTKLGRIAARASMIEAFLLAAEKTAEPQEEFGDVYVPNPQFLYSAMCMHPEIYEDIITLMRDLSGSAPITIPSSYLDFQNDEIGPKIRRYIDSPGVDSEDHVKLMKLIWDMMSSEFAGRYHLYEMFYAGPPHVNQMRCFANYDFGPGMEMVERFLDGYSLDSASDDLIDQVTEQA